MTPLIYAAAAGLASFLLTPLVRRLALRIGLVDTPNERTLHEGEVARAGGLAFVLPFLAVVAVAWVRQEIPDRLAFGLLVGAGGVAAVGFSDDLRPKPPVLRLILWTLPLLATLSLYGWMPSLELGFMRLHWGVVGTAAALVGGVWLVTLYNFMDGINGLAAGQAVVVAGGAAGLLAASGHAAEASLAATLAAAAAGFLVWNWRGRVFMGDVGATFLGATFAIFALHTETTGKLPLLTWLILLMPFLVDTTFTLIRRLGAGSPWGRAHREHAYQRAVLAGSSHGRVVARLLLLDVALVALACAPLVLPVQLLACTLAAFGLVSTDWFIASRRKSPHPNSDLLA